MPVSTVPPEYQGWWDGRLWPDDIEGGASPARGHEWPPFIGTSRTLAARAITLAPLPATAAFQIAAVGAFQSAATGPDILVDPLAVPPVVLGLIATGAVLLLTSIATALLARRDWQSLADRNAHRLLPWAWGLLPGPYLIGRAIILRRQGVPAAWPAILCLLIAAACSAVVFVECAAWTAIAIPDTVPFVAE